jgi:uncharacterized protein (DUF169 family)
MSALEKFDNAINQYVRSETYPVAIKLVKNVAEIPDGIPSVQSQLGVSMALCQGWGKVRFNGESIAMLKEDISCPVALFTLGLADPPQDWNAGSLYLNWYTPHAEAARKFAAAMYRLPKGKYSGVVMAPVHLCNFEPDMVVVYCDPPGLMRLIVAALMKSGGRFENSIFPPGVCTEVIAPVMEQKKCRFGIPCSGDRKYEYTAKDELVFSVPFHLLNEISDGLKFFYESGHEIPSRRPLDHASAQLETYRKLRAVL